MAEDGSSELAAANQRLRRHHRQDCSMVVTPPRPDRPVLQEPPQVVTQRLRRGITGGRLLGDRLEHDRLQVAGDLGVELAGRVGRIVEHLLDQLGLRGAPKSGRKVSSS